MGILQNYFFGISFFLIYEKHCAKFCSNFVAKNFVKNGQKMWVKKYWPGSSKVKMNYQNYFVRLKRWSNSKYFKIEILSKSKF